VRIFELCIRKDIKGYACAHEITTLCYFLEKAEKDISKVKKAISGIMKRFAIIEVNKEVLNKALVSKIDDFEDAVIEVSANGKNADCILTRNIKDFKKGIIPAKTPEELLQIIST
jgi:hypothetical protein